MKTKKLLLTIFILFAWNVFHAQIFDIRIFGKKNYFKSEQQPVNNRACNTVSSFKAKYYTAGIAYDGQNFWIVDSEYIFKVTPAGIYLDSMLNPAPVADLVH